MAKEYRIKIQNELIMDSQDVTGQDKQDTQSKKDKAADDNKNTSGAIALYVGKQMAQSLIGNFGALTGDYIQQANLNSIMELSTTIISAVKFGKVGVIMAVANVATKALTYGINKTIETRNADMLTVRTGGSR